MIKVTILYPGGESLTFDMDYYCNQHMPMAQRLFGEACKGIAVEEGVRGAEPGSQATYAAMGHFFFDSVEAFDEAMKAHAAEILGDIPNYTNAMPSVQMSEVKI